MMTRSNILYFPQDPPCDVCGKAFLRFNYKTLRFEPYSTCFECEYWGVVESMKYIGVD